MNRPISVSYADLIMQEVYKRHDDVKETISYIQVDVIAIQTSAIMMHLGTQVTVNFIKRPEGEDPQDHDLRTETFSTLDGLNVSEKPISNSSMPIVLAHLTLVPNDEAKRFRFNWLIDVNCPNIKVSPAKERVDFVYLEHSDIIFVVHTTFNKLTK